MIASGCVACIVITLLTGSIWLLCVGLMQILFSFPLAYAVYRFAFGLHFFPVLNLVGLLVSAALGIDDIFVATDKWKHARQKLPKDSSTEDVAAMALPESAKAMFLTTTTTSVAFFVSILSMLAPIYCFGIFCGLMIISNFILNCALVFPALCLYDRWILDGSPNWLVTFPSIKWHKHEVHDEMTSKLTEISCSHQLRPIQKGFHAYYTFLHRHQCLLLLFGISVLAISSYFAQTISLPDKTVMFIRFFPASHPQQRIGEVSRYGLLSSSLLAMMTGSPFGVYFGVVAKDTGHHNNPEQLTSIVLDDGFDPGTTEAQAYLLTFCSNLFDKPFAHRASNEYECSINIFDEWLGTQSQLPEEARAGDFDNLCKGAESLPMAEEDFHSCFIYWSELTHDTDVLHWNGKVRVMVIHGGTEARYDMRLDEIWKTWKMFESFEQEEMQRAPKEVTFFHSSILWWAADSMKEMQSNGMQSLYISIAFSTFVIFISSGSIICSTISALSIFFVFVSSVATLVALGKAQELFKGINIFGLFFNICFCSLKFVSLFPLMSTNDQNDIRIFLFSAGWTLGVFELICFAVLVGLSADFVIHMSSSYCLLQGHCSRGERTRYALVNMGPSILGSAFTTFLVGFVSLFSQGMFMIRFAQLLVVTILYSLIGACVFYAVIVDIIGPAEPTNAIDNAFNACRKSIVESAAGDQLSSADSNNNISTSTVRASSNQINPNQSKANQTIDLSIHVRKGIIDLGRISP